MPPINCSGVEAYYNLTAYSSLCELIFGNGPLWIDAESGVFLARTSKGVSEVYPGKTDGKVPPFTPQQPHYHLQRGCTISGASRRRFDVTHAHHQLGGCGCSGDAARAATARNFQFCRTLFLLPFSRRNWLSPRLGSCTCLLARERGKARLG